MLNAEILRRGLLAGLLAACAGAGVEGDAGSPGAEPDFVTAEEAVATITAEDMHARIAALAHDSMGGRDTPSPGLEKAASYLAGEFRSFGLEPAGGDGTYIQRYPFPLRALDVEGVHFGTVDGQGQDNRMLAHGIDFYTSPAGLPPGVDMFHGQLAWVGSVGEEGLPERDWSGVVPIVAVPGVPDGEWRSAVSQARSAAIEAGAVALMIVLDPEFPAEGIARFAEHSALTSRDLVSPDEIPVFYVSHEAASGVIGRAGLALEELPERAVPPILLENLEAHFAAVAEIIEDANPPNVVALLPGSDPELADTYVIFSAHMDHVGIGTADASGDSIYNGADDDASGTSALVEVAQAFAAMSEPPERSLIFLAVSGEEKGLLGSRWYSEHPTVPIEDIVANINVDMIARNSPDTLVVIGMEYSSLGPLVRNVATGHPGVGLTVVNDPWPEERFFFRSDHFNFARLEIPALFFFAGVHEDYHRPSDEIEKIDAEKAARVAQLIFFTADAIASSPTPPEWSPEGLAEIRELTR